MSDTSKQGAPRYLVVAGRDPKDKGIHDAHFGHYGVTFAKISFSHEYEHMPDYGAKLATEYAERVAAALNAHAELLAYAECEEARSRGEDIAERVLKRHGFEPGQCTAHEFMDLMRRAALSKATGGAS